LQITLEPFTGGSGVIVQVPAEVLYPEPVTATELLTELELGERTMTGSTKNLVVAETMVLLGVDWTEIVYPAAAYTDVAPTLNVAVSCPLVFTLHAGSPDVSKISPETRGNVHPVSVPGNPVPVTVTTVAAAPGEPATGGEPLVGEIVICAVTLNV
jgi:hypothetical protein